MRRARMRRGVQALGHGVRPVAGLIADRAGNLYGTTVNGGAGSFRGLVLERANLAFGATVHRDIETAKPCDGLAGFDL